MRSIFQISRGLVAGVLRALVLSLHVVVRILPMALLIAVFVFPSATLSLLGSLWPGDSSPAAKARSSSSSAKSMEWVRFDVDITVNRDGTIDVVERPEVEFTRGTFRNGYRAIPFNRLGRISDWSVEESDGTVYEPAQNGSVPGTFVVKKDSGEYGVNWYFEPISKAAKTYALSYKVHEALRRYEGGDQIWWKAIYSDRSGSVQGGTVRVTVPEGADIHGLAAYVGTELAGRAATARISEDERTALFELQAPLEPGEDFEVRIEFTPGIVEGQAPAWQAADDAEIAAEEARAARDSNRRLVAIFLALLISLGGAAGLYLLWYRAGRDAPVVAAIDYLPEPPDSLPPGMAGTLLDERADGEDIMATVVDLARRGALSISETVHAGEYVFQRGATDIERRPYEEEVLKCLFGPALDLEEVRSYQLGSAISRRSAAIRNSLYDAVVAEGYFTVNPETVRGNYWYLGVAGILLAMALNIGLWIWTDSLLTASLPGIALVAVCAGLVLLSKHMPRKTPEGAQAAARWQAFKSYLQNLSHYSGIEKQKEIWDQWLPYAVAFGVDKQYVDAFSAVAAPVPTWYAPRMGPGSRWAEIELPRHSDVPASSTGGAVPLGEIAPSIGTGGGPKLTLDNMSRDLSSGFANMSQGMGQSLAIAGRNFAIQPLGAELVSGLGDGFKLAFHVVRIVGVFTGGGSSGGRGGGGGSGGFK